MVVFMSGPDGDHLQICIYNQSSRSTQPGRPCVGRCSV